MNLNFGKLDDIKIFTSFYIDEHDNLSDDEKSQLHQFVIEATMDQMKCLLIEGIMKDKTSLREGGWGAAVSAINNYKDPIGASFKAGQASGMQAAAVVALAGALAYKAYKRFLSKAAKACKGKSGVEKTNCMSKFKQDAQKAKIQAMQSALSKCGNTKDPTTCKQKIQAKISKEKAKMGQL
jgi:hypothetical protein